MTTPGRFLTVCPDPPTKYVKDKDGYRGRTEVLTCKTKCPGCPYPKWFAKSQNYMEEK